MDLEVSWGKKNIDQIIIQITTCNNICEGKRHRQFWDHNKNDPIKNLGYLPVFLCYFHPLGENSDCSLQRSWSSDNRCFDSFPFDCFIFY